MCFSTFSRNLKLKYSFCGLKILKWLLKQIFTTLHIKKFNDVIQEDSYSDFEQELIKKSIYFPEHMQHIQLPPLVIMIQRTYAHALQMRMMIMVLI